MSETPVIHLQGVFKKYHLRGEVFNRSDIFWVLRNISLQVKAGECLGIMGKNGAGKTTLLQIMANIVSPTYGSVSLSGKVAALLAMEGCLFSFLNARENASLILSLYQVPKRDQQSLISKIIELSGLASFMDMPVKNYSTGMRSRLAVSIALHIPCDILLFDEALSTTDDSFQIQVLEKLSHLKSQVKTIVFVSHRMSDYLGLTDRILWIDKGEIVDIGDPPEMIERYLESLSLLKANRLL